MTSYYTASTNFGNNSVSMMNSPPSENSLLARYLRSGQPSDQESPILSRPFASYHHKILTGSCGGGSSRGSNRTPLSPMSNLQLSSMSNIEEDVLVMDGVLVEPKAKGGGSGSGGGKYSTTSSLSSGGGANLYVTELCKAWEVTGDSRYGYKRQFAHVQEEMPAFPKHLRNRYKSEISKSSSSPLSSSFSPRSVFSVETTPTSSATTISKMNKASTVLSNTSPAGNSQTTGSNWSPLDDSIRVQLPGSTVLPPTREAITEHINNVLCGPTQRKRLSVFRDLCPDSE